MSILIKGMEMPAMCSECDFCGGLILPDNIYTCDCPSEKIHGKNITRAIEEDCRHPNCPLIEVPEPHGDLTDVEELMEKIAGLVPYSIETGYEKAFTDGLSSAYEIIKASPTIIPASEEGET